MISFSILITKSLQVCRNHTALDWPSFITLKSGENSLEVNASLTLNLSCLYVPIRHIPILLTSSKISYELGLRFLPFGVSYRLKKGLIHSYVKRGGRLLIANHLPEFDCVDLALARLSRRRFYIKRKEGKTTQGTIFQILLLYLLSYLPSPAGEDSNHQHIDPYKLILKYCC